MQPVVYLLVRIAVTWLQYLERDSRAFVYGTQLVLIAGAAHAWAVVYALFVAVLARVSRHNYIGATTYEELLPWWVEGTERIAALAMVVWWLAGCLRLLIHLAEDDAKVLPMDVSDVGVPAILKAARSPVTRLALATAQAVSCTGLFLSVVLLCFALLVLPGSPSAYELGLVFVASSFALPLFAMALQQVLGFKSVAFGRAAIAAAAENASLGPQFCVILALMDVRDHSHLWTRHLFPLAAAMFVAATIACASTPPKHEGAAVPPDVSELAVSAMVNMITVVTLTLCFSMQSGWVLVVLSGMLLVMVIVCVALWVQEVRDALLEISEVIMPLRNESSKLRPGAWRDLIRVGTRAMVLLSAVVALWDVTYLKADTNVEPQVPHQEYSYSPDYQDHSYEDHSYQDHSHHHRFNHDLSEHRYKYPFLLRYLAQEYPGDSEVIEAVSETLKMDAAEFRVEHFVSEYRIVIIVFSGSEELLPARKAKWHEYLPGDLDTKLVRLADSNFPPHLDKELCDRLAVEDESAAFSDSEMQAAYSAACKEWPYYQTHDEDMHDYHHDHGYEDYEHSEYGEHGEYGEHSEYGDGLEGSDYPDSSEQLLDEADYKDAANNEQEDVPVDGSEDPAAKSEDVLDNVQDSRGSS